MAGLDDAFRLIPVPFLYVCIKNSRNSFYVTGLYFLGKSVVERAGMAETVQCYLKIEFSGAFYKYKPIDYLIAENNY